MNCAIIVAGGSGIRMGSPIPKQYLTLAGRPILAHTVNAFCTCPYIHSICLVVPSTDTAFCESDIVRPLNSKKRISVVTGGDERQDSVYNGLKTIADDFELVVIHDGVRPFVSQKVLGNCIRGAQKHGACTAALPVNETLKSGDDNGCVVTTMDRRQIFSVQTPQAFHSQKILYAHEQALQDGFYGTDDAVLLERLGQKVKISLGSPFNIKITTPEDLRLSEAIINSGIILDLDTTNQA